MKYHAGGWSEPGLAPGTTGGCRDGCRVTGGRFSPLNLAPQGYMHVRSLAARSLLWGRL
jgi:hypothetical protein